MARITLEYAEKIKQEQSTDTQKQASSGGRITTDWLKNNMDTLAENYQLRRQRDINNLVASISPADSWNTQEKMDQYIAMVEDAATKDTVNQSVYDQLINSLRAKKQAYGEFASDQEYTSAVQDYEYRQKYSGLTYNETQRLIEELKNNNDRPHVDEIEWLNSYGMYVGYTDSQSYDQEISQIDALLAPITERINVLQYDYSKIDTTGDGFVSYTDEEREVIAERARLIAEKNELEVKKAYLERKRSQVAAEAIIKEKYEPLQKNPDFAENSQYDDQNNFAAVFKDSIDKLRGAEGKLAAQMETNEVQIYNYLDKTQGKAAADAFFDDIRPLLNERLNTQNEQSAQKFAQGTGVFASIVSLGSQLVDGVITAPIKFIGSLTGDYEDNWASYDSLTTFTNTVRQERGQAWNEAFGTEKSGVGSFVYQTLMSIGDMGVALLVSKGVGTAVGAGASASGAASAAEIAQQAAKSQKVVSGITQVIMSSQAATHTMSDARERGLNGVQIASLGLASAATEWITEKYSLEALLGEPEKYITHFVKNVVTEASEEAASSILNTIADNIIAGNQSAIKQQIGELMASGMGYQDAVQRALLGKLEEIGLDALGGALSGGIMGGGSVAIDKLTNVRFSVPTKYSGDLASIQSWVAEKFQKLKSTVNKPGLGTVMLESKSMTDAIQKAKNADQAVAFVAINDIIHKGVVTKSKNGNQALINTGAALNGNVHAVAVSAGKTSDGKWLVTGLTVDGETIYDASAYAQQALDSQATEAADSGEVAPKLVAGEDGQDSGFDYDSLNRITQASGQRAPVSGAALEIGTQANAVPNATNKQTADFGQQKNDTVEGDITQTINNEFERENISNGERAIAFLINKARVAKNPEELIVKNAMFRPDIGNIDFVWGVPGKGDKFKHGYGIAHIIAKRNSENGSGMETVKKIIEAIARSKSFSIQRANNGLSNERIKLTYDGCTAVLSQSPEGNHWLLTGWHNEKETATYADGEVRDSSEATAVTPTLTRRNGGNVTVSNERIAHKDGIVNPYDMQNSSENSNPDVLESRSYDYTESKENWMAENRNEGSAAEVESLDSIVSDIEEVFGVPINKGNIRQKNAAGIFKTKVNAIRTKLGNALPTICHELGHLLDKNHKLTSLPSIGEAVTVMQTRNPEFASLYGENQQKGEAVAEFVREYLRDRTAAKQKYPKFFAEVVSALGEDLGKLNAISDKVNAYMYASMSEHIAANTTNRTNARRKKGGFAKRMKSTVDWVVKHMFEDVIAIRDVSEKAYKGIYDARKAATVVDSIINNGMTDVDGNYVEGFEGVSLKSILEPINNIQSKGRFKKLCESITGRHESSYDEFCTYLVLKRGLDLAGRGIPIFGNGDPSMQDPAKIQQEIDKMEAEYPEFKEVADQLYAWEKALGQTYYVNTGAMSQEDFDAMWERDPHYVPFNRNVRKEIVKSKTSSRFGRPNSEIKRIKGGSEELFDPIENIVLRSALMVQNAKNGRIMQILALEVESGRIDSSIMEKISETKAGAINAALDQKSDALRSEDQTDGSFDDVDLVEWTGQAAGENIVWATINGERVLYEVHDPELLKALLNSTPHQADILTQVIGKVNSAFKMATTGANLIWSVTSNSFRDFATGYYYGSEGNFLKYTRDYVMAARDVIWNRQSYQDAKAAGMGYTSRVASPKTLSRVMLKLGQNQEGRRALTNAFNSIIEGIQSLSEVVEATPRLAEYKRAIQQGKSKTDAVYAASEVTLNFDRKGDWSKAFDTVYPFFNVQMQGLYKQAQMIADPTTRMQFIRRKVVSSFVMAAFVIAANAVLGGKDEYEKLSDYIKNNYYCFYIGNGKFIKIPKARELDVLESALERMGEIICYGNDMSDSFNGFAEYIFQAYAPLGFPDITALFTENGMDKLPGFFKPTFSDLLVLGSFAEIAYNENYAGSPIVPTQYQDLHATEQYDNKTSGIAKLLGRITKTSPMQLDHLMVSNTGFIGKLLKAYTAEDLDWFGGYGNQFTADVAYSNDVTDQFYDGLDEAEIDAKTYPDNSEYQARYQQYSSVSSVVSYFYKQAKADPENAREYRMLAVAYAEEFLESGTAQNEKLNALYEQTADTGIYPYLNFEASYSQKKKDENGEYVRDEYDNTISEEITMSPQEFLEYVNTYNSTIDIIYEEILNGISEPKLAAKSLSNAKSAIKEYARTGALADVMIAEEAGINAATYYQITLGSSTNGASGVNQSEAKEALSRSGLTRKQCSVMWELMFPTAKSNPYKKRYY